MVSWRESVFPFSIFGTGLVMVDCWIFWCVERLIREMVSLLSLLVLGDSLGSLVAVELTVVVTLIFYWQVRCNNCWISYVRIHVFKFNPTTGKSVSKAITNISVSISLNLPLGQGFQLTDPSPYSFVSYSVTVKYLQHLILLLLLRTFQFCNSFFGQ